MGKPPFDPNKPFEVADKPPFDPSAPFEEAKSEQSEKALNPNAIKEMDPGIEAALLHGVQGATGGLLDEATGGIHAALRAAGLNITDNKESPIEKAADGPTLDWEILRDAYRAGRDHSRKKLKNMSDENPVAAGAGNLVGSIASPLNKLATGMSLAKGGAVLGGVNAFGNSEADDLVDLAKDTAIGAGLGAGIGKGIEVASPYVAKGAGFVSDKAKDLATRFHARAAGVERATAKKLGPKGVEEVGEYVRDNKLLSPLSSAEDILAKNEAVMSEAMNKRASAYNAIDDAGASTFNPLEAAARVEGKIIGGKNRNFDDTQELVKALDPHLSNILSRGEGNISMKEAQYLVESLGKKAKFDTARGNLGNEVAVDAYHELRSALNDAASSGADKVGVSGLKNIIEQSNKTYSTGLKAKTLLDNKFAREQGNKIMGLTDTVAASEALGALGGPKTAAVLAAKKGLERFGAQNAALGLDKVSKALMRSPKMANLSEKYPQAFQAMATSLEQKMSLFPETLPKAADQNKAPDKQSLLEQTQGTKYNQVLQNAAARGDDAFNAANYVLMARDPDYRKTINDKNKQKLGSDQ